MLPTYLTGKVKEKEKKKGSKLLWIEWWKIMIWSVRIFVDLFWSRYWNQIGIIEDNWKNVPN